MSPKLAALAVVIAVVACLTGTAVETASAGAVTAVVAQPQHQNDDTNWG